MLIKFDLYVACTNETTEKKREREGERERERERERDDKTSLVCH